MTLRAPRNPARRRLRNGFSLVELLVALFIVGLLAGAAVLAMPDSQAQVRRDAESFAVRVSAARDEAITAATPVAVTVGPAGYYFEHRQGGAWQPMEGSGFAVTDWSQGVAAELPGEGNRRFYFDTLGLASEDVRLVLARGDVRHAVAIARDGSVRVE